MTSLLTDETFTTAAMALAARDRHLGEVVAEHGVPEFWHRPATFATLALFIVEQQVSLASAQAVFERMVATLGAVTAEAVASASESALGSVGLTRQKLRYLRGLAESTLAGAVDLEALAGEPDDEVRRRLLEVTGIGPWTADVYLLSALRRPDVWPVGDRALQVGVGDRLQLGSPPTPRQLADVGERWRPHRSVAARLIWHDYLRRRGRAETMVRGLVTAPPSARD